MRSFTRLRSRRCRLHLETLEGRETPAGIVRASIVGGVLILVGDDRSNTVIIKLEAGQTTLTPDATTDVGGLGGAGSALVIPSLATSLKATMRGGDDTIQSDVATDFSLPGGAHIDMGDGAADLCSIFTSKKIDLGSLTVKGTDGFNQVDVSGGVGKGSQITGHVMMDFGKGGSTSSFTEIKLIGPAGVSVHAADGFDQIYLTNVEGGKPVRATLGNAAAVLLFDNAKVGAVTVKSENATTTLTSASEVGAVRLDGLIYSKLFSMGNSKINGNTVLTTQLPHGELYLNLQDTALTGNLSTATKGLASHTDAQINDVDVTGSVVDKQSGAFSYSSFQISSASTIGGNFTMQSSASSTDITASISDSAVLGAIKIASAGKDDVDVQLNLNGTISPASVTVQGGNSADFDTETGSTVMIDGDLKVSAKGLFTIAETRGTLQAKNVLITGPSLAKLNVLTGSNVNIANKLTMASDRQALLHLDPGVLLNVAGDVKIDGKVFANLESEGTFDVGGRVSVKGSEADIQVVDGTFTVDSDFLATGSYAFTANFAPAGASTIQGNASFKSGLGNDRFDSTPTMKFAKDLLVDLKDGANQVSIAGVGGTPTVSGKLTLNTGHGDDVLDLTDISVNGTSSFSTGAGSDQLRISGQSTLTGAVAVDFGADDDLLELGFQAVLGGPVTITGTLKAKMGTGNDTIKLGNTPGNLGSLVVFAAPGSTIDGGLGLDFFDDEAGKITNPGNVTLSADFVDPTP